MYEELFSFTDKQMKTPPGETRMGTDWYQAEGEWQAQKDLFYEYKDLFQTFQTKSLIN